MKKLIVLVAVILIAGLLAGCWVLPESKLDYIEADPDKVTLNPQSLTGITQQLEVTAFYDDDTIADVTSNCDYISDRPEVVTVNDEGLIVGVKPSPFGALSEEATILVTHTQHNFWTGRIIRTCKVDVTILY